MWCDYAFYHKGSFANKMHDGSYPKERLKHWGMIITEEPTTLQGAV